MSENSFLSTNILCRICALPEFGIGIFTLFGKQMQLSTKIFTCLGIRVLENDNLPKHICFHCLGKLSNLFAFQKMSREAQNKIIALVNCQMEPRSETLVVIPPPMINGNHHQLDTKAGIHHQLDREPGNLHRLDTKPLRVVHYETIQQRSFKQESSGGLLIDTIETLVGKSQQPDTTSSANSDTSSNDCRSDTSTTKEPAGSVGKRKSELTPEEKEIKKKERRTVCFDCGIWMTRLELETHETTVHLRKGLQCLKCNTTFPTHNDWKAHNSKCST